MLSVVGIVNAQTLTPADNKAKETISTNLAQKVNNHYDNYALIMAKTKDNQTFVIYNSTSPIVIPPPAIEICGDGIDNDGDGLVDEDCPIIPPPSTDKPIKDVNASKWFRIGTVGDIDNNAGLDKQLALAKDYHVDTLVVPGDYAYTSGSTVLSKITNADFNHVVIVCGNHDSCSQTQQFMQMNATYGEVDPISQISFFLINGNGNMDCSSPQFANIKDQLSSSDAWYNIPVIHQPYVTVKSDHGPNGQFSCWNPLFAGNGVKTVLQAHNHNYQRIDVNGIDYLVVGTGTHDTGSNMYPIGSDNWNGFKCQKCITGVNGVTIMDLQIDNPAVRNMNAWFLDNSGNVKDKFN